MSVSAGIRSRFGEWVSSSGCRPQTTWGVRALGSGTAQLSTRTTRIASHLQATVWGIAWGMAKGVAEAKIGSFLDTSGLVSFLSAYASEFANLVGEWLVWKCCDSTAVCFERVLLKSSVCTGTGWPSSFRAL